MDPDETDHDTPPKEDPAIVRTRRWNRFKKILIIFVAGWVSVILEKMVKLDSVISGGAEGFIGGIFIAPFLLIITLPLAVLGSCIGSWKVWKRRRSWFTVGLPVLLLSIDTADVLYWKSRPWEGFEQVTGVPLSRDAKVERWVIDDGYGPLYDSAYTFEFTCSPEETERLIRELKLTKSSSVSSGRPAAESWTGKGLPAGRIQYVQMEMDATRTKLRVLCYNI
ncbi:hypothetical protein OKA04_10880 [Luteolibacter flavescens]|uniref:Uncharacterized protein n=1 Tax=Luteolibacter flavescens TaxID=1859460 RepID=A0ABT3FNT1_9BACT|nr:hypothetical protein [Luteolibacter flavescens]MCW1885233.1 hypothetical protein [Luteolibacter flavescens]